jgi:curved DNA-binding protein CbpA
MANYYEILGIAMSASPSEIKSAYRRLSKKHHPDKGGSGEEFIKIQTAYECLIDPEAKILYDSKLNHQREEDIPSDEDFSMGEEEEQRYSYFYMPYGERYNHAGRWRGLEYEDYLSEYYETLTKGKANLRASITGSGIYPNKFRGGFLSSRLARSAIQREVEVGKASGLSAQQIAENLIDLNWGVLFSWWKSMDRRKDQASLLSLLKRAKPFNLPIIKPIRLSLLMGALFLFILIISTSFFPTSAVSFSSTRVDVLLYYSLVVLLLGSYKFLLAVEERAQKLSLNIYSITPIVAAIASVALSIGSYLVLKRYYINHISFMFLAAAGLLASIRVPILMRRYNSWLYLVAYVPLLLSLAIYPSLPYLY